MDEQATALADALEAAEQRAKETEIVIDPVDWEEEAEKIKAEKDTLTDEEINELKIYGKILEESDRIKLAQIESAKFKQQSNNTSFRKS